MYDAGKIVRSANADTTSCRRKLPGIEHDRRLVRKIREQTVRGSEGGLRKRSKQRAHLKKSTNWCNPPFKTQKLAIDLRSPITVNSPPNPPSHLQTATNSTKISTEHSRSTSAAGPSGCTAPSSAGSSSHASTSTRAGPSTNALPNHAHDQSQFIESFALTITKQKKQMPQLGTMGAPVCGGADITKFIEEYQSLSSRIGTDTVPKQVIAKFPYYCSDTIHEMIKMMNRYLRKDCIQLNQDLKGTFQHVYRRVYMYMRLYL